MPVSGVIEMKNSILSLFALLAMCSGYASEERFAEKPRYAGFPQLQVQAAEPGKSWKELSYIEDNPLPEFAEEEKRTGMMLFTRPLTAPVYPQTRPAPWERTRELCTFAAQGQIATLNFAVFPTRALKGLTASAEYPFKGKGELRQITYANYRFPHYTTTGAYRRSPGWMVPAGRCDVPRLEPQRYVLNLRIPDDAKPGIYSGRIQLWHSGFDKALVLPYRIRVLPYRLSRDPGKHISAYAYGVRQLKKGREHRNDSAWLEKASVNDFRRMKEYGFTCPPTLFINYTPADGGRFYIQDFEKLQGEWQKAGLSAPRLIALGAFTSQLYRKYMGKAPVKTQLEMPPDAFYAELERLAGEFRAAYEKAGLPELYVLAVDEPLPNELEYVKRIYRALKNAGLKTFITTCPFRKEIEEYVDVWVDQRFDPLDAVRNSPKAEFWCYPNHNVYELRNTAIMTRGGRMTYGFGFWRSGYRMMIPWMWSWNEGKPVPGIAFGGQMLTDSGDELIEWEWESVREGIVDGAYLYTLQEAIVRREGTDDPKLRSLLKDARNLLQEIWNSIPPESKYLADNHWSDGEFESRRAELASMILKLKEHPEINRKTAPSILADVSGRFAPQDAVSFFETEDKAGNLFRMPIPLSAWRTNGEDEGSVSVTPEGIVDFRVNVDHKHIGNGNGYYRGTPSLAAVFPEKLDMMNYAFISYQMKVSSNRHIVQGVKWPHQLLFFSVSDTGRTTHGEICPATTVEPGIWHHNLHLLKTSLGSREMSRIAKFWFYFREGNYEHGDRLSVQLRDVCLIGAKRALVQTLSADTAVVPAQEIRWHAKLFGKIEKPVEGRLTLSAPDGKNIAEERIVIDRNFMGGKFAGGQALKPGEYSLGIELFESGRAYQKQTCRFKVVEL